MLHGMEKVSGVPASLHLPCQQVQHEHPTTLPPGHATITGDSQLMSHNVSMSSETMFKYSTNEDATADDIGVAAVVCCKRKLAAVEKPLAKRTHQSSAVDCACGPERESTTVFSTSMTTGGENRLLAIAQDVDRADDVMLLYRQQATAGRGADAGQPIANALNTTAHHSVTHELERLVQEATDAVTVEQLHQGARASFAIRQANTAAVVSSSSCSTPGSGASAALQPSSCTSRHCLIVKDEDPCLGLEAGQLAAFGAVQLSSYPVDVAKAAHDGLSSSLQESSGNILNFSSNSRMSIGQHSVVCGTTVKSMPASAEQQVNQQLHIQQYSAIREQLQARKAEAAAGLNALNQFYKSKGNKAVYAQMKKFKEDLGKLNSAIGAVEHLSALHMEVAEASAEVDHATRLLQQTRQQPFQHKHDQRQGGTMTCTPQPEAPFQHDIGNEVQHLVGSETINWDLQNQSNVMMSLLLAEREVLSTFSKESCKSIAAIQEAGVSAEAQQGLQDRHEEAKRRLRSTELSLTRLRAELDKTASGAEAAMKGAAYTTYQQVHDDAVIKGSSAGTRAQKKVRWKADDEMCQVFMFGGGPTRGANED